MGSNNENDTDGEVIYLGDESDVQEITVNDRKVYVEETVTNPKEDTKDDVVGVVIDNGTMQEEDKRDIQKVYEGRNTANQHSLVRCLHPTGSRKKQWMK